MLLTVKIYWILPHPSTGIKNKKRVINNRISKDTGAVMENNHSNCMSKILFHHVRVISMLIQWVMKMTGEWTGKADLKRMTFTQGKSSTTGFTLLPSGALHHSQQFTHSHHKKPNIWVVLISVGLRCNSKLSVSLFVNFCLTLKQCNIWIMESNNKRPSKSCVTEQN